MTWFRKKHPVNKGKLNEMADTSEWSATCATFHHKYCKNKYKPYCKCPCHLTVQSRSNQK